MSVYTDRLETFLNEGRLTRKEWASQDDAGRATACLLAALVPECGRDGSAAACPAELMPAWLAHLTPWIDDAGSEENWMETVFRFADLAASWHVLDTETWRRLEYRVKAVVVREAVRHTTNAGALSACETVIDLCDRAASGEAIPDTTWSAARSAARSAERSATWSAARSAESAAWSAESAASSAAWNAESAASAVDAANAAADRIIAGVLDAIETAIRKALAE